MLLVQDFLILSQIGIKFQPQLVLNHYTYSTALVSNSFLFQVAGIALLALGIYGAKSSVGVAAK